MIKEEKKQQTRDGQLKGEGKKLKQILGEKKRMADYNSWWNGFTEGLGMFFAGSVPPRSPPAPPPLAAQVAAAAPLEHLWVPDDDGPVLIRPSSLLDDRKMLSSPTDSWRSVALDTAQEIGGQLQIAAFAGVDWIRTPVCHQQLPLFVG